MLRVLNQEIQTTEHERFGVSAFIIMTHGTENFIYGTDSHLVKLSDILDLMSPYTFKAMAGKPKIVVIQACSGGEFIIQLVHYFFLILRWSWLLHLTPICFLISILVYLYIRW